MYSVWYGMVPSAFSSPPAFGLADGVETLELVLVLVFVLAIVFLR